MMVGFCSARFVPQLGSSRITSFNLTEFVLALCSNENDTFNALNYRPHDGRRRTIRGNGTTEKLELALRAVGATGPGRRGGSALAAGGGWTPCCGDCAGRPRRRLHATAARARPRPRAPAPPRRIPRPRRAPHPAAPPPHARRILAFSPPSSADPTRTKSLHRSRAPTSLRLYPRFLQYVAQRAAATCYIADIVNN